MKITEIFDELNKYAPLKLSTKFCKKFDCYDNSGILLSTDEEINSIIMALDITKDVVNRAIKNDCKLIITHHPVIFTPGSELTNDEYIDSLPDNNLLKICKNNNIGIISFHLNLDTCKKGIDYYLAKKFGDGEILQHLTKFEGYGRTISYNGTIKELFNFVQNNISSKSILYTNNKDEVIKVVNTYCGGGLGMEEVELAPNANCFISSDVPHHVILKILENNQSLIMIDHYESEIIGFKYLYNYVNKKIKIKTEIVIDSRFTSLNN